MNHHTSCRRLVYDYQRHAPNGEKHFKFEPALYIQRYEYVSNILVQYNCLTYLDIGCSECHLLNFLKNTNSSLNLIIGVDINQTCLENACHKMWIDLIQNRNHPLELYLIKG